MQPKLELVHSTPHPMGKPLGAPGRVQRRSAWFAAATLDVDRLEAEAKTKLVVDSFLETRVLLIGFTGPQLCEIRQTLRAIRVSATAAASNVGQLQDVAEMGLGFTHVLVNFDAFDDVEAGVDALMAFRSAAPELVVVVCSEMVSGDDFGTERARICDATLKLPTSATRLARGLVSALSNRG